MSSFTYRQSYQDRVLDRLRVTYGYRSREQGIPVPQESLLRREAAAAWATALEGKELEKCLVHWDALAWDAQNAVIAEAARRLRLSRAVTEIHVDWHPADTPPDDDLTVLLATDDGEVDGGFHDADAGWCWQSGSRVEAAVVSWREMPNHPGA